MNNEINTTRTGGRYLRGLKARREKQGLSVEQLAQESDVTQESIRRFEAEEARTDAHVISALANVLRCYPDDITNRQTAGPYGDIPRR